MGETKEEKKLRVRKRNLLDFLILQFSRLSRRDDAFPAFAPSITPAEDADRRDEEIWSAHTQEIRNRITGKRHMARERWNRAAGTSESGGRGL